MSAPDTTDRRALLQDALGALERMQAKLDGVERDRTEPIAIVGVGCRFPGGANDPEAFWTILRDGVDAITEIPSDRWPIDAHYDPDPDAPGKMYVRGGGFLERVDEWDADFFGVSPREAARMDPQQRLLLEVAWEALERAGRAPDRLAGSRTGVFVGITCDDYAHLLRQAGLEAINAYHLSGSYLNFAAGRLAYVLGLQGPALAVDTACSSSLVAVHLACQSLRARESDLALAAGVNLILSPDLTVTACKARMLAPDSRCKTFDASANGFVRSEGCGVIVLERLSDALAHGDRVLALVRGSAVNQDGHTSGLTVPNKLAQEAVIRQALASAGVEPADVSYVEAHGTGTALGDPIELRALGAVLGRGRRPDRPAIVGSVKTNLGHLESAAGIAGLIKVALALGHREIPPHLHLRQPTPHVDWAGLPLRVATERTAWPAGFDRRIAGVSSFGASGTNAHVILEEAPTAAPVAASPDRPRHLLALSGRTPGALHALAARFASHLGRSADDEVADICFSAATGRAHHAHRLGIVAGTRDELRDRLTAIAAGEAPDGTVRGHATLAAPRIAFLFTGQGSQHVGMGRELYDTQPTFRRALEQCDALLRPRLPRPLLDVLYPAPGAEASPLDQTAYTQPALFAVEYALAELWRSWGVTPSAVLGHSVGEYVAACVAGVFTLEAALALVAERGRLMQALPAGGAMAAVFADEPRVAAALAPWAGQVGIAAVNGPDNTVISGADVAVRAVLHALNAAGVETRPLTVSHAFHSPLMDPMLDDFERAAIVADARPARMPMVSNVTGRLIDGAVTEPVYWRRHVRDAVQFAAGVRTLHAEGCRVFIEIGPRPTLLGMARRCLPEGDALWLPSLGSGGDWDQLLGSVAGLWVSGISVDWLGFDRDYRRRRVTLPTYPFERQRHWLAGPAPREGAHSIASPAAADAPARMTTDAVSHPLLGVRLCCPVPTFEAELAPHAPPFLQDHRVQGRALVPAAAFVEMGLAAAAAILGPGPHTLRDVVIPLGLELPEGEGRTVHTVLTTETSGAVSFGAWSRGADGTTWVRHASGGIVAGGGSGDDPSPLALDEARRRCPNAITPAEHHARLRARGLEFGPSFRGIEALWRGDGEALARVCLPEALAGERAGYRIHPALLDACLQPVALMLPEADAAARAATWVPVSIDGVRLLAPPEGPLWSHVCLQPGADPDTQVCDVRVLDERGGLVAEVSGFCLRRIGASTLGRPPGRPTDEWRYEVEWREAPALELARSATNGAANTVHPPAASVDAAVRPWLILADTQGVGQQLAERLRARGDRVVVAVSAGHRNGSNPGGIDVDPERPDDLRRVLHEGAGTEGWRGVIHLWALDSAPPAGTSVATLHADTARSCAGALHLVQALAALGAPRPPRLWLVTRGGQAVGPDASLVAVTQAPLWGLGQVIALEHPELRCVNLDLDPIPAAPAVEAVLAELDRSDGEDQVAFRHGTRHVARLVRRPRPSLPAGAPADSEAVRLEAPNPGVLDGLVLRPADRRSPGPREVEIRVDAIGLNFRDVLSALGLYPGDPVPLGIECAGSVEAVGASVTELRVGDPVIAVAPGCFGAFVTAPVDHVVARPEGLSAEEGATLPSAFMTAQHALHDLARIAPGDRVLIHAAAGGVGMAALQLARRAGAEIFATAGSVDKRQRLQALGVEHVMDSRSLDFADEVRRRTGGRGVDVVLNSLSGDFIAASVSVLAPGGRFVEIGRRDIWSGDRFAAVRPDARYFVVDLGATLQTDPALVRSLLGTVVERIRAGDIRALPHRVFPMSEVTAAFRHMAQARHVGKIVVAWRRPAMAAARLPIRPDATYLVTGGLRGLGLLVAEWLVEHGARHLALMGRHSPSAEAAGTLARLEQAGAQVLVAQGDVAREADVAGTLARIAASMPPLRGIIHAAGIIDDGILLQQTWSRFAAVLAPKVDGGWLLHTLTRDLPLDLFVLFSSAVSLLGSSGQGSHVAASAFLDALAHHRDALGLPAISIDWGPWSGAGAAADAELSRRLAARGLDAMTPREGLDVLAQLLGTSAPRVGALRVRWDAFLRRYDSGVPGYFEALAGREAAPAGPQPEPVRAAGILDQLRESARVRHDELLIDHVRSRAARVLGVAEAARIDVQRPLQELGLDSLMAVELRNVLARDLEQGLPATVLFDYPTVQALAVYLRRTLTAGEPVNGTVVAAPAATEAPAAAGHELDRLSDTEAEALLLAELSDRPRGGVR